MSFGTTLDRLLRDVGLTANELDRLAGRPRGSAWLLIDRDTDPRCRSALAYAEVLGVTLDWLVAEKGPQPDQNHVLAAVSAARARAESKAA